MGSFFLLVTVGDLLGIYVSRGMMSERKVLPHLIDIEKSSSYEIYEERVCLNYRRWKRLSAVCVLK